MPTKIAVITADNHLRPCTWSKHPELQGDSYVSFEAIIDYCIEHKLPLFLLGDTFDAATPPADAVVFFATQVDRMERAALNVYFIKGNHDDVSTAWPEVHRHCRHIDQETVNIGPFKAYGLDFCPAGRLQERLLDIPVDRVDIILTHQSWKEIQRVGHTDASFNDIPWNRSTGQVPVLITGDYHIHGCYNITREDGVTVNAFSPGSTSMQKINEEPVKYFYVAGHDNGQLQVDSVQLPTRGLIHFDDVRTEEGFNEALQLIRHHSDNPLRLALPEPIQRTILRVRFNDAIPDAYSRLIAAGADKFHFFDEPQHVAEEVVIDTAATPEGAFDSLLTAIGQLSEPGSDEYAGVRRLLEAVDPKAELEKMFHEHARSGQSAAGVPTGDVE